MWDEFVESQPDAMEVAKNYGHPEKKFDEELLVLWKRALKDNLAKVEVRAEKLRQEGGLVRPTLWLDKLLFGVLQIQNSMRMAMFIVMEKCMTGRTNGARAYKRINCACPSS